jgi:hypothetical protein
MNNKKIKISARTKENIIEFIYFLRDAKYVSTIFLSLLRPAENYVKANLRKWGYMDTYRILKMLHNLRSFPHKMPCIASFYLSCFILYSRFTWRVLKIYVNFHPRLINAKFVTVLFFVSDALSYVFFSASHTIIGQDPQPHLHNVSIRTEHFS